METHLLIFYVMLSLFIPLGFIFSGFSRFNEKKVILNGVLNKKYKLKHKNGKSVFTIGKIEAELTLNSNGSYFETEITAEYDNHLQSAFQIIKETKVSNIKKEFGIEDVLTQDAEFDKAMLIKADNEAFLLAFLQKKVRVSILQIAEFSEELYISDNYIQIRLVDDYSFQKHAEKLNLCLHHTTQLLTAVQKKNNIINSLIRNIKEETDTEVAAKNFLSLIQHYSNEKLVQDFYPEAFKIVNPKIQIESAQHLGDQGMQFLSYALLDDSNYRKNDTLRIITILKESMYKKAIPQMKSLLSASNDKEIKKALLSVFTVFSEKSLSEFLISLLVQTDHGLHAEILDSLANCGNINAVETLYSISRKSINPVFITKVKTTITAIQSRLCTKEVGLVSLAENETQSGAVSVQNISKQGGLSAE